MQPDPKPSRPALPGLFVVGTDTGVGKTRVAAAIARNLVEAGRKVGVLKPVATGAVRLIDGWRSEDAERLIEAVGGGIPLECVVPILFETPLAPPVAARLERTPLSTARVIRAVGDALRWWGDRAEVMVVEGVGGLLSPLADEMTVADLAIALDFPIIIVARRGLGTLNHTLLTVEAAQFRGLRVAGIVLNSAEPGHDPLAEATNPAELARRLDRIPILGELDHVADPSSLSIPLQGVDWYQRARPPRLVESPAQPDQP